MISKVFVSLSLLFSINQIAIAQEELNSVERAMKDELERSMNELKSEKYEDPFFIRYRINEQHNVSASATFGALQNSADNSFRSKDIRVMIGDYEFNDESLDSNVGMDNNSPSGYFDFSVPLGDDYYGIRRSLWLTTDAIYKVAGQVYKNHLSTLEKDAKTYKEIDHKRFAEVPQVEYLEPIAKQPFTKELLETYVKQASKIFTEYENLLVSGVRANNTVSTEYFLNSEGTRYRTSKVEGNISFTISMRDSIGNVEYEVLNHPIKEGLLPSMDETREIIENLISKIVSKVEAESFQDSYFGPVLFTGKTVSNLFSTILTRELYNFTELSYENDYYSGYNRNAYTLSDQMGQQVVSKELSISAYPKMTHWEGIEVTENFKIDSEGVVPPDTLTLIENGILKNLMTTRTLVGDDQKANGTGFGPGVLAITSSEYRSEEQLKQQLIDLARKYDQKYAVIVKEGSQFGGLYNLDLYKVNVDTGEQELFKGANITSLGVNNLKRIIGMSSSLMLNNLMSASYITPNALLLEDIEVTGSYKEQIKMKEPMVKSPLID